MIDGCLVVNLPCRTDRWKLFQGQIPLLESLGITPERMDAVYGRELSGFGVKPWFTKRLSEKRANAWAGKAGCTLSHRNAIITAKERGWNAVLILEDDVAFDSVTIPDQWKRLLGSMAKLPENWIAIYLYGHRPVFPVRVIQKVPITTCYEVHGAITTAAYIINGRYFDQLLKLLPERSDIWEWTARNKTVDRWYSRQLCLLGRVYAFEPFGIINVDSPSDATTAGQASSSPSFQIKHVTNKHLFSIMRIIRILKNGVALYATSMRYWVKKRRGL